MSNPDRAALGFVVTLACGVESDALLGAWRCLAAAGQVPGVSRLAALFALRVALGRFVMCLEAEDVTNEVRVVVARALVTEAECGGALRLLTSLLEWPGLAGTNPVVVKGAGLALLGHYDGEREMVDADVLIDPMALPSWKEAATRIGAAWRDGDPQAYEMAYVGDGRSMVELHSALAGPAGKEPGPTYSEVLQRSAPVPGELGARGLRAVTGRSAREIVVHHFVFHHSGDPTHALRTLQDLARLEGAGEGAGLPWRGPSPAIAVHRLRQVVREVRDRRGAEGSLAAEFVERLAAVTSTDEPVDASFTDVVDRWLGHAAAEGEGRLRLVWRRLFVDDTEWLPDLRAELGPARRLARRAARPFRLTTKYARGALARWKNPRRTASVENWRNYLASGVG